MIGNRAVVVVIGHTRKSQGLEGINRIGHQKVNLVGVVGVCGRNLGRPSCSESQRPEGPQVDVWDFVVHLWIVEVVRMTSGIGTSNTETFHLHFTMWSLICLGGISLGFLIRFCKESKSFIFIN